MLNVNLKNQHMHSSDELLISNTEMGSPWIIPVFENGCSKSAAEICRISLLQSSLHSPGILHSHTTSQFMANLTQHREGRRNGAHNLGADFHSKKEVKLEGTKFRKKTTQHNLGDALRSY